MEPDFLGLNLSSATYWGFPGSTKVKNPPANAGNAGDAALIPGLGRFPRVGNGNPHLYSCLENSMDRGAWQATVHAIAESRTLISTSKQQPLISCVTLGRLHSFSVPQFFYLKKNKIR